MRPLAVRDLSLCATVTRGSLRAGWGALIRARLAGDVGVGRPECASHKIPPAPLSIYSPLKTASFVEWCCLGSGRWKFTSEKWKHKHSQFFISKMVVQCLVKWIVFLSLQECCVLFPAWFELRIQREASDPWEEMKGFGVTWGGWRPNLIYGARKSKYSNIRTLRSQDFISPDYVWLL